MEHIKETLRILKEQIETYDKRVNGNSCYFLHVDVYKSSGKFYLEHMERVELNSYNDVFDLVDLIKTNDPKVSRFSPLPCGFTNYNFHIYLEDNDNYFLDFLWITNTVNPTEKPVEVL